MSRKPQSKLPDAAIPPLADPPSIAPHEVAEPRQYEVPAFIGICSPSNGRLLAVDQSGNLWEGYIQSQARFGTDGTAPGVTVWAPCIKAGGQV